jgi:hypothetical protein
LGADVSEETVAGSSSETMNPSAAPVPADPHARASLSKPAGEHPMEIHNPHPVKSWKEFFIELGTIVAGILIALALEQSVEALRERGLAREATEAVNAEMQENLDRIAFRQAQQACADRRLNEIAGLLADWGRGKAPPAGITIGQPNDIPLAFQRWQANLNSGRFSRQPAGQQSDQAAFYTRLTSLQGMVAREHTTWSRLAAIELGPDILGTDMRPVLVTALQDARAVSSDVRQLGGQMLKTARLAGLTPRPFTGLAIAGNICAPLFASTGHDAGPVPGPSLPPHGAQ